MSDHSRDEELSRRELLKRTAAAGAVAVGLGGVARATTTQQLEKPGTPDSPIVMPKRKLGKTGVEVSLLGFGGGSRFLTASPESGAAILERAIALGITYFDTAANYGKDRASEKRFGETLPKYRDKIFLTSKTEDRTYDGAMRSVERSLKELKTDHLDLIQIHAAAPKDDPAAWEKPDGVLTALRKLRDQKMVRFIGFTGHDSADTHKKVIEMYDFDTVLMAINAASHKPFREIALPAAVEKGMGIIGMKTVRGLVGSGNGKATPAELLAWVYDLPVSSVIIGMESLENVEENVKLTASYKPSKAADHAALRDRLAPYVTAEQLGWAMPGYRDGMMA